MPTKPLDRLMFAQGNQCFFCGKPLPKSEASVEHLVPTSRSGSNSDDNCVVCCKAINNLLGSMSLKEKIRVVLNQKGRFTCPTGADLAYTEKSVPSENTKPLQDSSTQKVDSYTIILADLRKRGNSRPRKVETLKNSMHATLKNTKNPLTDTQLDALLRRFQAEGKVIVAGAKVSYSL